MAFSPVFCDNPRTLTRPSRPAGFASHLGSPDRRGFDDLERIRTELLMADEQPTKTDPTPASGTPAKGAAASDLGGYNASMIKSLDDVEHVRTRPGMYIGGYNPRGLHHLVYEIVDNSVDEALAGHAKHVEVRINP